MNSAFGFGPTKESAVELLLISAVRASVGDAVRAWCPAIYGLTGELSAVLDTQWPVDFTTWSVSEHFWKAKVLKFFFTFSILYRSLKVKRAVVVVVVHLPLNNTRIARIEGLATEVRL